MGRRGEPPRPRSGGLGLRRDAGGAFELVHPRCVEERREDYEEGLAIWRAGEPDEAREVLLFALEGCSDNLRVHVALGRIALEAQHDPVLARGHFGYAFELARAVLPPDFTGPLPADRPANRPLYDAIAGLCACLDALGQPGEAVPLRRLADRWRGAGA
jgi:hypothetical protein